jgi:hypothetical protein
VISWPASSSAGAKFQAKLPAPRIAIFNFIKKLSQFSGKEKAIPKFGNGCNLNFMIIRIFTINQRKQGLKFN